MASDVQGCLPEDLRELVNSSKVFVVGAGGIGCELLKNLVLFGFKDIHIIDLDTIDVSNLNRQFLFRKEHVGRPKSIVAKESALTFNPTVNITAYHDSITESKYDVNFYKQFSLVLNALDNRTARSHVNRMCLAGNIPLVESGTAGYKGNVSFHMKGVSECYDCTTKPHQKTYPGCTIRNTPSEPIHCIVWAKHLFNQLFGVADPDEDVSPDSSDPEAVADAGKTALDNSNKNVEEVKEKVSTRQWAQSHEYDAQKLFQKLFQDDIKYLLSMENLWQKRRPPTPLDWNDLPDAIAGSSAGQVINSSISALKDQRVWSMKECAEVFKQSVDLLKKKLVEEVKNGDAVAALIWDKDDDPAMDFVTSCANIRSHIFGIQQKSRFDTKSMAGNIIPAIASTNAIVAGLIVTMACKVLRKDFYKCNTIFVMPRPTAVKKELFPLDEIVGPNPKCYVCAEKPEITVKLDLEKMTIRMLGDKILKTELCMIAPDVEIDDGQGTILISSEEGETDDIADKLLKDFQIKNGTRLRCDDFLQNYQINVTIEAMEEGGEKDREKSGIFYEIIGDRSKLNPKEEEKNGDDKQESSDDQQPSTSKKNAVVDEDDDLMIIEPTVGSEVQLVGPSAGTKRRIDDVAEVVAAERTPEGTPVKKRKIKAVDSDSDVEILDDDAEVIDID